MFEIHPSTLTQAADCELRSMVSSQPKMFRALGYNPRRLPPTVGRAVGQGVHSSIAYISKQKQAGEQYTTSEGIEKGIEKFRAEIVDGMQTDDITRSANDGEQQIKQLTTAYWGTDGYKTEPLLVEQKYRAGLTKLLGIPGYEMNGTLDRLDRSQKVQRLIDIKTGKKNSLHPLQIAAYLLLLQTHGEIASWVGHVFLKRVARDQNVERPVWVQYDAKDITDALLPAIKRLVRNIEEFKTTQNPLAFATNPSSMYCSEKFCPAYKSDICSMWKLKEAVK